MIRLKYLDLVKQIFSYCAKYKLKICTAESCTGGLLSAYFTYIPGSSKFFNKGLICYTNEAKIDLLHVPKAVLDHYGAVSFETVMLMAQNNSKSQDNYISIATTGMLGPDSKNSLKSAGLVYIAINIGNNKLDVKKFLLSGDRHKIQNYVIEQALLYTINNLKSLFDK